jgi:hypothetical protein
MEMRTLGPIEGCAAAFGGRAIETFSNFSAPPKLGLLFLPFGADYGAFLRAAKSVVDVPIVGATSGGAVFTERGVSDNGYVFAVLAGEDISVDVVVATRLRSTAASVAEAVRGLPMGGKSLSMLTLFDAFACDGEALVQALRTHAPVHCRHFGGAAGDSYRLVSTRVFADGRAWEDAAVMVTLRTERRPRLGVHHGWRPVPNGRAMQITEIDGKFLMRLDGAPAITELARELRSLERWPADNDTAKVMTMCKLGVVTPFGEGVKVRSIRGIREDGALILTSGLAKSDLVRLVEGNPDQLVAAAQQLATDVVGTNEDTVGQLVFDCGARVKFLGTRYREQVEAFRGGRSHPVVGFACYGEIAKFGGSIDGFHNAAAVSVAW